MWGKYDLDAGVGAGWWFPSWVGDQSRNRFGIEHAIIGPCAKGYLTPRTVEKAVHTAPLLYKWPAPVKRRCNAHVRQTTPWSIDSTVLGTVIAPVEQSHGRLGPAIFCPGRVRLQSIANWHVQEALTASDNPAAVADCESLAHAHRLLYMVRDGKL